MSTSALTSVKHNSLVNKLTLQGSGLVILFAFVPPVSDALTYPQRQSPLAEI